MISICMIGKNEEKYLEKCLAAVKPLGFEIVFVDTGSMDRTKEIAKKYTDKIFDFPWVKDFSAARNFSIEKASYDFVLVLDCDEIVKSFDKMAIEKAVKENPLGIGRILRINEFTRNGQKQRGYERVSRLFDRRLYHYEGMIHEQIVPLPLDVIVETPSFYNIELTADHYGYEGSLEDRKKKTARNIALLEKQLEQEEEQYPERIPYTLYQLGKSYYMQEEYKKANIFFSEALNFSLDEKLEYVQDMIETYGYSLLRAEEYQTAMGLLNVYDEFSHSADFVFMIALVYMNNGRFNEALRELAKVTKYKTCKMEGVTTYQAWYNAGVIHECLGEKKKAMEYYKRCGNYGPALEGIRRL